ncbi:MFS transporter [Nocardioides lianchengensis]|uniref:Predicted arabinose efflux permease, MFS family n=1 Tax=Nocardioides lianchengensis TaxID=1045774 RepID=A0A1G6JIQ5_9ACTN|nr:MFS transporter [Nocardioides lianchengensis]NYG12732.1 MFS family permease [Nocardioides lianchengensis]SDC18672.1 Predicted arabinose efflux permease, MFS family [Nocardioides lianchengensis]
MGRDVRALAPLREHNFRWYFLSRLVNLCGTTMAPVALAFAVLEISDSPGDLGLVLAAHSIPMVVFVLAGGVIADRLGRTLVIQGSNVLSALSQGALAVLLLSGHAELWHFVVLSAFNGTVSAASLPALAGLLPQLVPREQLQPANVLASMSRNALAILGPSVAATLVVTAGPGWALAVDAATWAASAALLLPIRIPPRAAAAEPTSVLVELREGWTYFRSTTWLWVVVLSFGFLNAIHAGGLNTLGPVLAKDSEIGEHGWGLIMSAEAVGLFVMTLLMMRFTLQRPLLWGMLGVAVFGLPIAVLGAYPHTVPVMLVAVLAGMGIELFGLGWNLAMQEHVPIDMLSRVYSYDMLGSFVAIPIGQLAFGPLAEALGIRRVLLVAGIVYLVIALATLFSRSVRTLPRVSTTSAPASG